LGGKEGKNLSQKRKEVVFGAVLSQKGGSADKKQKFDRDKKTEENRDKKKAQKDCTGYDIKGGGSREEGTLREKGSSRRRPGLRSHEKEAFR